MFALETVRNGRNKSNGWQQIVCPEQQWNK
jgi:hypothetical protein